MPMAFIRIRSKLTMHTFQLVTIYTAILCVRVRMHAWNIFFSPIVFISIILLECVVPNGIY